MISDRIYRIKNAENLGMSSLADAISHPNVPDLRSLKLEFRNMYRCTILKSINL